MIIVMFIFLVVVNVVQIILIRGLIYNCTFLNQEITRINKELTRRINLEIEQIRGEQQW